VKSVVHATAVGELTLSSENGFLVGVWFGRDPRVGDHAPKSLSDPILDRARRQIDQYFARRRREFSIPLDPRGTPFQRRVWTALQRIPYGTTTSYGAIARAIRAVAAVRAVGSANGANPIPIIIPCHRVIGADGSLTGFGGGLDRKKFLLDLERGVQTLL
jgi:methylated-DNA-[protein]-cysteine S-methyltransferase